MIRKTNFFEDCFWFKFNNLGLALDMALKFQTRVAIWLKLKARNCKGLIPTFVEVIREKQAGRCNLFECLTKKQKKDTFPHFLVIIANKNSINKKNLADSNYH